MCRYDLKCCNQKETTCKAAGEYYQHYAEEDDEPSTPGLWDVMQTASKVGTCTFNRTTEACPSSTQGQCITYTGAW